MLDNKQLIKYIVEVIVLIFFIAIGFYIYLIYQHNKNLHENAISLETLKEVNAGLPKSIYLEYSNTEKDIKEKDLEMAEKRAVDSQNDAESGEKYSEQKLFEFLSLESQPKFLDNLMDDLVIKNNSTTTVDQTCSGKNLLENDECKKSLFIGCSEAMFLKFALVNECRQFSKDDYVNYLKAKKLALQNSGRLYYKPKPIQTEVGEVTPSEFTLSLADLKDTIDSSVLNNDFTKNEDANIVNDSEAINPNDINKLEQDDSAGTSKKELASLLGSLTGVIVKYSGWVQGWATIFAVNNGRPEAGFKMYKTTAFGYNPYKKDFCLVSLPYKTVDKFFGTSLDYCVKTKNVKCIQSEKAKVKGSPIEVLMIKNGLKDKFILGDLGPSEWTGNAIDLNGCVARKLKATGKDQVRFRVAR